MAVQAVALGDTTQLDLLWLPQAVPEENGGVVRFQTNLFGWDGSLSAGKPRGGAYVPIGRSRDPETGALRSEYGSGGFGAFAQVGIYVP